MTELARITNASNAKMVKVSTNKVLFSCLEPDDLRIGFLKTNTGELSKLVNPEFDSPVGDGGVYVLGSSAAFILSTTLTGQALRIIRTGFNDPTFFSSPHTFRKALNSEQAIACGANNRIFAMCHQGKTISYDILHWTGSKIVLDSMGTWTTLEQFDNRVTSMITTTAHPARALVSWATLANHDKFCQKSQNFCISSLRYDGSIKEQQNVQFSNSPPIGDGPDHQHIVLFPDLTGIVAYRTANRFTVEFAKIWDLVRAPVFGSIITFNHEVDWMDLVQVNNNRALFFYTLQNTTDLRYRIITAGEVIDTSQEFIYRENCTFYSSVNLSPGTVLLAVKDNDNTDLVFEKLSL